jgi:hypothetical protein
LHDRIAIDNDPKFPPPDGSLSSVRSEIAQVKLVNQESQQLLEAVREHSNQHRSVSESRYLQAERKRLNDLVQPPFSTVGGGDPTDRRDASVDNMMTVVEELSAVGETSLLGILAEEF